MPDPPERGDAVVGVDIGGTKVAAARLVDGTLADPHTTPTHTSSSDGLIDQIVAAVEQVRGDGIASVGIGVPSVVEWSSGTARSSVNVPLQGVALRGVLEDRLGVPVFVDNDANCAAFAEAHDDAGQLVTEDLVMFTVGTGVGGGLVLGGRLYRGATGAAAELGHTLVGVQTDDDHGAPAAGRFPQQGSLEVLSAGRALDRFAANAAREHPESALGRLGARGGGVSGPDAVAAAHSGDEIACGVVRRLGEHLGLGIANAINTFDPQVVAIGGGASRAGDLLLKPARELALQYVLPGVGTCTEIRLARHGVEAGLLGAALMAAQEIAGGLDTL